MLRSGQAAAVMICLMLLWTAFFARHERCIFVMQAPFSPEDLPDAAAAAAAEAWAAGLNGIPPAGCLLLAHDHLINLCTYDADAPFCHTAYGALQDRRAVCDGYAAAFAMLAEAAGIRCTVIQGTAGGLPHAWNLAELDGAWYHIDCTWDEPAAGDPAKHDCFLLSDAAMRRTHSWDAECYPAAAGGSYSYAAAVKAIADLLSAADRPSIAFSAGEKDTESKYG